MLKTTIDKVIGCIMSVLLILMLFNTAVIPFDKALLPVILFFMLFTNNWKINKSFIFITLLILEYLLVISVINIGENNLLVFFPIFFSVAGVVAANSRFITIADVKRALFVNILFGVIMVIASYMGFENDYVLTLSEKGLPFIKAPVGFSPTLQTYGTCCILWLILALESKKQNTFFIVLVGLILLFSLNRASILLLLTVLFFYKRKMFYSIFCVVVISFAIFFEFFHLIFLNLGTINSRTQLRYGAELSYWNTNDIQVLLFGRANHQTSTEIAQRTVWEREYIENGLDFIAHSYGLIGLFVYVFLLFVFIRCLIKRKQYSLAIITTFYLTLTQYITNEFLSSTFMFFIMVIIMVSNKKLQENKI